MTRWEPPANETPEAKATRRAEALARIEPNEKALYKRHRELCTTRRVGEWTDEAASELAHVRAELDQLEDARVGPGLDACEADVDRRIAEIDALLARVREYAAVADDH